MKKFITVLAGAALVLGLVSCGSTKVKEDDDLSMFMASEPEGPEFTASKDSIEDACKALSEALGVGVKLVVDKDMSKADAPEVKGATATMGTYLGEKCVKITANFNPEIRFAFVLDKPVPCKDLKKLKFSVAGFDGGAGAYNCAFMYEEMNGAEHKGSFYLSDIATDAWTDVEADLVADEQWGNNYKASNEVQIIQFWSGDKGPIYVKGLTVTK